MRIQRNRFATLLPFVLLLAFSISQVGRLGMILLFSGENQKFSGAPRIKTPRRALTPAMGVYEDMVTGALIRGQVSDNSTSALGTENPSVDMELSQDNGDSDQLLVTGTLSGHWSFARVTIREKNNPDSLDYPIGEEVAGYRIQDIEAHSVVLKRGGFTIRVNVGETVLQAKERLKPKIPEASGEVLVSSQTIQKVLSREDVNRKLKDPNAIYKNARFGPHLVDGKIDGYKLYQVARDHVFYSLGARSGDVIRRVNGMPLSDTEKMLELWNSVKMAPKITVDLERQGKIISYEFIVRN